MHVFVTGASGGIASCLIPELVSAGHTVTGLARSEQSAERVCAVEAIAEEGIALRDIATTSGERLGLPAEPVDADRVQQHFGFRAAFVALDNPATSTLTRERLGWTPTRLGLLEALRNDPRLSAN